MDGVIEFVSSGSRFRIYIPTETVLITFLLSGISCPRASRIDTSTGNPSGGDEFGDEALLYVKELIMQKEVQIEIEGMDKGGNFIGFMFIEGNIFKLFIIKNYLLKLIYYFVGTNLSVSLVQRGLSKMHFTAERTKYYGHLQSAEETARSRKIKVYTYIIIYHVQFNVIYIDI